MGKLYRVQIGSIYALQDSVSTWELSTRCAHIFHQATQEEILCMTKHDPLDVYLARLAAGEYLFLRDGAHRSYIIRYHSKDPSPDLEVYVRQWENIPDSLYPIMEERRRQRKTISELGLRY